MTFSTNASSAALNKPVLREGSTGEAVKELQQLLLPHGVFYYVDSNHACVFPGEEVIDGIFGPKTTDAVSLFQSKMFLPQDGIVDDRTWRALYLSAPVDMPILRKGDKSELVKEIQQRLFNGGYYTSTFDGDFGPATEVAVKDLQIHAGLSIDGVVGNDTWYELGNLYTDLCL